MDRPLNPMPPRLVDRAVATRTLRLLTNSPHAGSMPEVLPGADADSASPILVGPRAPTGNEGALLGDLVYQDLRQLAANLLRRERSDHTLQPTALVHEAWIRLIDETAFVGQDVEAARAKFLSYAVQAMRRILIEHARRHKADKRGAGRAKESLTEGMSPYSGDPAEQLDLDLALRELAERKPRAARIAELRIYGGVSVAEAAKVVDIPLGTAKQDWALALALLTQKMRERS
ncbi:MAG: ECF-type sigma factor [Planctomycetota bacterium]